MSQSHHTQDQVPSSPVPNRLASYGLSFTLHPSAHPCVALSQSDVLWPSILCPYFLPLDLAKDCLLKELGNQ